MLRLLLISFIALSALTLNAQITFQKVYGGTFSDFGTSVHQTTDNGYIVVGTTTSFGSGGRDVLVIKTNEIGDTLWSRTFGGATDNEYGFCGEPTTDGGYIISGVASSFDDVAGDMYLIKLDASGDTMWTRTYGGNGYEWGSFVQQTMDGGFIITGQTPAFGAGGFDAYLVKTNAGGDIVWTKTYGGIGSEYGNSVQQTTDGGYVLTGSCDNNFGFGGSDFYLIKTDSTGNHVWSKAYGQTGSEEGKVVRQTTDGGYLIAGTSENALGPLGPNMCLIKTNSVGDTLWAKLYGGAMIDECYDAKQTSDGGYIMVGKSFSFSAAGDYDVYVVKVNAQGIAQWSKTYGGSATNHNEIGYSVDQTNDRGYIISGESMFGFGVGIVNMYLIKTDSLGNSGCNQGSAATVTSNYLPQVIATATLVGTGGNMKMPASLVNSGTTQTNLCLSGSTNIHDLNEDLSVTIYPNPFEEIINIAIEEISQLNSIKIYNVFGQEVYSQINLDKSYSSNKIVVELKDQKKGIFLIELRGESFDRTFKLIKQ